MLRESHFRNAGFDQKPFSSFFCNHNIIIQTSGHFLRHSIGVVIRILPNTPYKTNLKMEVHFKVVFTLFYLYEIYLYFTL